MADDGRAGDGVFDGVFQQVEQDDANFIFVGVEKITVGFGIELDRWGEYVLR